MMTIGLRRREANLSPPFDLNAKKTRRTP